MSADKRFDRIIIGAGIYGMYAAIYCASRGERVIVLERDDKPFSRATYVNQARVHMGYHYPRSLSTAMRSAGYYRRFHEDFGYAVKDSFRQIYATSARFSWTSASQFVDFCAAADIPCREIPAGTFFREGMTDGAFETLEDTFDAVKIRYAMTDTLSGLKECVMETRAEVTALRKENDCYAVEYARDGKITSVTAPFVLNATYASVNQIMALSEEETVPFSMKYELCEILLCNVPEDFREVGVTVMDGPFFSVMPFGLTGMHSLTAVSFTPHMTCVDTLPSFPCQEGTGCTPYSLMNCDTCEHRPESAFPYMQHLAAKYLREEFEITPVKALFSMKPILLSSEVDDSRPTAIRVHSKEPAFVSVLSGKINTVYDLDGILDGDV